MTECIFCRIIAGEIPSARVYEDDMCIAFLDINPVTEGHTILAPKAHSTSLIETDDETLATLVPRLRRIVSACVKGVGAEGCSISTNNGRAAGQSVFHLHWHIIPRRINDGLKLWPQRKYTQGEQERIAGQIRASF